MVLLFSLWILVNWPTLIMFCWVGCSRVLSGGVHCTAIISFLDIRVDTGLLLRAYEGHCVNELVLV